MRILLVLLILSCVGFGVYFSARPAGEVRATPVVHDSAPVLESASISPVESASKTSSVSARRSELPLLLIGTIVHSDSAKSLATIKFKGAENSEVYGAGSDIRGIAIVNKIERDRLLFLNKKTGALEFVSLEAFDPAFRTSVDSKGARDFQMDRKYVDASLAQLSTFINDAGTVPVVGANGQVSGFRMTFVKPGSVFEKLGLKEGDILKNVNGTDLTGPEKAIELFNQLRESSLIQLKIERGGSPVDFTYLIR